MIPRELLQIISYLDIQIKDLERHEQKEELKDEVSIRISEKLNFRKDGLEEAKKWIMENYGRE